MNVGPLLKPLTVALSLVMVSPAVAQDTSTLKVRVKVKSQSFTVGEPILLEVYLANDGAVAVELDAAFSGDTASGGIRLWVAEGVDKEENYKEFPIPGISALFSTRGLEGEQHRRQPVPLQSKSNIAHLVLLTPMASPLLEEAYPFAKAGTFFIRATYREGGKEDRAKSDGSLKITLAEATEAGDKAIGELLLDKAKAYLKCGVVHNLRGDRTQEEVRKELEKSIATYPKSALAKHLTYLLARTYHHTDSKAVELYDTLTGCEGFALRGVAFVEEAACRKRCTDVDGAYLKVKELKKQLPEDPAPRAALNHWMRGN